MRSKPRVTNVPTAVATEPLPPSEADVQAASVDEQKKQLKKFGGKGYVSTVLASATDKGNKLG